MSDLDIYEEIGKRLKKLRESSSLTLKDVADKIGISSMTLSRYESNSRKVRINTLQEILKIYGVDYEDFINSIKMNDVDDLPILKYFDMLNSRGKDEAVKRVKELTYIPEFKKVNLIAAHERTDIEITDEMIKYDDELMNEDDWLNYDELISEAEQMGLIVKEKPLQSADGRILNNKIVIRDSLDELGKKCVLAEEIGHYLKNAGDILDQRSTSNSRQEDRARSWAYDRLIGLDGLVSAFECGCQTKFDVAEYLDVTTAFLDDALKKYKERYGIVVKYKEYFIYFYPCLAVLKK